MHPRDDQQARDLCVKRNIQKSIRLLNNCKCCYDWVGRIDFLQLCKKTNYCQKTVVYLTQYNIITGEWTGESTSLRLCGDRIVCLLAVVKRCTILPRKKRNAENVKSLLIFVKHATIDHVKFSHLLTRVKSSDMVGR